MKRRISPRLDVLEGRELLSGLAYSLTTDASTYQAGQPVVMTFQETNDSSQAIQVEDGPSIDGFDVTQGGKTIWRSNSGMNPMFIRMDTLQPGQSLTLTATWDGVPDNGSAPVTGTFTVSNQLNPGTTATISLAPAPVSNPAVTPPQAASPPVVATNPDPQPQPTSPPADPPASQDPSAPLDPPSGSTTTPQASPLSVSVSTDHATARVGHKVRVTMTLKDSGNSAITVPASGQLALSNGTTTVWHSTRTLPKARAQTLQPGQSIRLTTTWNGRAQEAGASLAKGTYSLVGQWGDASASTALQVTG
jgi:hypothetical protein